ncbi:hypothetical protein FF38_07548 [Lucilia cuprina]|uniref:Uncharacterized protein n=1 Tax=Lucilia cuprina TaxID=7375 RepID=A0A0L0C238_LUCCU|nr:hypothetical protein FF38_07548 [Lucilia cuprina]
MPERTIGLAPLCEECEPEEPADKSWDLFKPLSGVELALLRDGTLVLSPLCDDDLELGRCCKSSVLAEDLKELTFCCDNTLVSYGLKANLISVFVGVVDLGDLACVGDLAEPVSEVTLDEEEEADELEPDFLFLSIDSIGLTAEESAPICEQKKILTAVGKGAK